jgi:hypothetical protein
MSIPPAGMLFPVTSLSKRNSPANCVVVPFKTRMLASIRRKVRQAAVAVNTSPTKNKEEERSEHQVYHTPFTKLSCCNF